MNVTVYNELDLTKTLRVSSQGTLSFPLIGTVKVAGLTPAQVEKRLEDLLSQGYFKNPPVSVLVVEYRSKEVFVLGAVNKPGTYPLTGPATLLEMISRAGGVHGHRRHQPGADHPVGGRPRKGDLGKSR